jgi:hypothetical protein
LPNRKQPIVFRRFLTILHRNEQGVPGPFGRASFLGAMRPSNSRFLSVIRKSGSRFSGEIALQPLSDAEETT